MTSAVGTTDAVRLDRDARIALVGCGKMGEAMLSGWLASDVAPAGALAGENFVVVEPTEAKAARLAHQYGVEVATAPSDPQGFDMIVLAVKPQVMPAVLEEIGEVDGLVTTIAAGIPTDVYERALGPSARVVRVMPNMPLQVGMGASVVSKGASATDADAELVRSLFAALGTAQIVPEEQIDAVCAISGGGPAYVAYMVEALRDAGVALGLDASLSESLALQTIGGTWRAMVASNTSPEDMRASVCSPGGTTLAALAVMDDCGFKEMFSAAMRAAVERAAELRGDA